MTTTYKVEILTATKAGLAAFLRDLKRAKLRHALPVEGDAFLGAKQKKPSLTYAAFIDRAVTAWEKQSHAAIVAEHKADVRAARQAEKNGDRTLDLGPELRDHFKAARVARIHSIKDYIGPLNRDVNENRTEGYARAMEKGDWWFTPDPITITDAGEIINGQHRLLAAECVLTGESTVKERTPIGPYDRPLVPWEDADAPSFVVVWGVDKRAAILMDEARRTATDRRDIAIRYAKAASA
jgi:hypothetical protein